MASSISAFKERLIRGGSRPNLFEVSVSFPDAITSNALLSNTEGANVTNSTTNNILTDYTKFLAKSAQIPGMNLGSILLPYRGRVVKFPGDRTFEPFTITVHNDGNNYIRSAFEAWSDGINGLSSNVGTICFPDYARDVTVTQLGRGCGGNLETSEDLPKIRSYKLINAWVANVSPIDLDFGSVDQISQFSVTFEYDYFVINDTETTSVGNQ